MGQVAGPDTLDVRTPLFSSIFPDTFSFCLTCWASGLGSLWVVRVFPAIFAQTCACCIRYKAVGGTDTPSQVDLRFGLDPALYTLVLTLG